MLWLKTFYLSNSVVFNKVTEALCTASVFVQWASSWNLPFKGGWEALLSFYCAGVMMRGAASSFTSSTMNWAAASNPYHPAMLDPTLSLPPPWTGLRPLAHAIISAMLDPTLWNRKPRQPSSRVTLPTGCLSLLHLSLSLSRDFGDRWKWSVCSPVKEAFAEGISDTQQNPVGCTRDRVLPNIPSS